MKHPKHYETDESTSKRMSSVKLKKGNAETLLAKKLWHLGIRYRLNDKRLPGSPDIAILKYHIAVFVDGEFWHGFDWDNRKSKLNRNRDYWIEKIEENITRDIRVDKELALLGWYPIHFWSNDVMKNSDECIHTISEVIFDLKMRERHELLDYNFDLSGE